MEVIAVKYDDVISVTGIYQGRLMLFIIELQGDDYICRKAVNLGKEEKSAVHSIMNSGRSVYLADSYNNKIYKYDYVSNELSEETVGRDPRHMCIDINDMYVANFESDNISVIDLCSFALTESIPAGIKPHDVLYSQDKKMLYACCYEENEIIGYSDREPVARFTTDGMPMHMLWAEDSIIVMTYFINGNVHSKINFIDAESGKIEKVLILEGMASDLEIDYPRNRLYVINIVDKNLYVIDTAKKEIIKTVFLGGYPESLTAGEKFIYVTNSKKNNIAAVDKDSLNISKVIALDFSPCCIKIIN